MLYSNKFQQLRKRCEDLFMTNESKQYCWRRNEKLASGMGDCFSMVVARDVLEYAKIHLPILLGTHTSVRRKQPPREVHRIH